MSVQLRERKFQKNPVRSIEKQYLKKIRRNTYMACMDLDLLWDLKDVKRFDEAWDSGYPIDMIACALGRDPDEVAILAIDRAFKGKITNRVGGVFGNSVKIPGIEEADHENVSECQ